MALYPAPSPSHAEPTLQPSYFTSSLYTELLRQDIEDLILRSRAVDTSASPFPAFKQVWCSQGWHLLQFRVFDDRNREAFLRTTFRLLLERSKHHEPLFTRIIATFGLFTFYSTQPLNTTPTLWHLKHIPTPIDQFHDLHNLDESLVGTEFIHFQPTISFILRFFQDRNVFLCLPQSSLFPENPRVLPRETYVDQGRIAALDPSAVKKKGRPSKNDKTRKAKATLGTVASWLEKTESVVEPLPPDINSTSTGNSIASTSNQYSLLKSQLLAAIDSHDAESDGHSAIIKANQLVLQRLKEVRDLVPDDTGGLPRKEDATAGVGRVENAVGDLERGFNRGIFDLHEGSGKR